MSASDPVTSPRKALSNVERELRERLRFETLLADLALRFQRLPADRLDGAIDQSLRDLVETLELDRATIMELSKDGTSHRFARGYARPGVPPMEVELDLATAVPWYTEQIRQGRRLVLTPEDLPEDAHGERAYAQASGIKSHAVFPLLVDRELVGSLGLASFRQRRRFSNGLLSRMELAATVFASALYRRRADTRLHEAHDLNRAVLASLTSAIAVLDREGRVLAVNEAWVAEAAHLGCPGARCAIGDDYLEACRSGMADGRSSSELLAGVRAVLAGQTACHRMTLRCPCEGDEAVLLVSVTPLAARTGGAVVKRTDVTELERARAALEATLLEVRGLKDRLEAEKEVLQDEVRRSSGFDEIVGTSPALARVLRDVEQVGSTAAPVLILGETGTGKDLVARAIHERSPRKNRTLVTVNCAALPPTLMESELFGYEKGAFTGATTRTLGRFEVADGGAILLDEVGELPLDVQAKLLRVLQTGEFERLGSSKTVKVDVRVIAATNRDLERETQEGRFRADLYYRLNVFPISVPPLRERAEDVPLLVWHFITRKQVRLDRKIERVPERFMRTLGGYTWPGNIRELENVVERALIMSNGSTLATPPSFQDLVKAEPPRQDLGRLDEVERAHILAVLASCGWKISGKGNAADRLGLNRSTLQFRMKKLRISRPLRA
jgi:formate hydrogenlyase transcriptional activator